MDGGQRQRIAIARAIAIAIARAIAIVMALMTNPRVLIFDEAISALDDESERVSQDNMRFIAKGRTVIIIAHRLSAVRDAQRIIVLEQREVVEEGPHAELIKRPNRRYARLQALQMGTA